MIVSGCFRSPTITYDLALDLLKEIGLLKKTDCLLNVLLLLLALFYSFFTIYQSGPKHKIAVFTFVISALTETWLQILLFGHLRRLTLTRHVFFLDQRSMSTHRIVDHIEFEVRVYFSSLRRQQLGTCLDLIWPVGFFFIENLNFWEARLKFSAILFRLTGP